LVRGIAGVAEGIVRLDDLTDQAASISASFDTIVPGRFTVRLRRCAERSARPRRAARPFPSRACL